MISESVESIFLDLLFAQIGGIDWNADQDYRPPRYSRLVWGFAHSLFLPLSSGIQSVKVPKWEGLGGF